MEHNGRLQLTLARYKRQTLPLGGFASLRSVLGRASEDLGALSPFRARVCANMCRRSKLSIIEAFPQVFFNGQMEIVHTETDPYRAHGNRDSKITTSHGTLSYDICSVCLEHRQCYAPSRVIDFLSRLHEARSYDSVQLPHSRVYRVRILKSWTVSKAKSDAPRLGLRLSLGPQIWP